jgi:hypothetical protein
VTSLPSGYLHAVLALGTEDQIQLLEAARSFDNNSASVQTTSAGRRTTMVPMPAPYDDSNGTSHQRNLCQQLTTMFAVLRLV